jgi:DNA repair protein RadC
MQAMDRNALGMQEQFLAIYLNRANTVIGIKAKFIGGLSSVTTVDIKIILSTEIGLLASGVIICQNHPSGNLKPPRQDRQNTTKIKAFIELIDVSFMDYLILFLVNK